GGGSLFAGRCRPCRGASPLLGGRLVRCEPGDDRRARAAASGASLAMKERLVMFAAASGAVILFLTMFISSERGFGIGREVPRPTSEERGGNGYIAAVRWLAAGRVPVVSLQESL